MRYLLPLLVFLAGCSTAIKVNTEPPKASNALAKTEVYIASASTAVEQAKPHTSGDGKVYLSGATASLQGAAKANQEAAVGVQEMRESLAGLQTENQKQADKLEAYKQRWLGDKLIRLIKWVVGIWLGFGLLGCFLKGLTGGWLNTVGSQILYFLPFANGFKFGASYLETRKQNNA